MCLERRWERKREGRGRECDGGDEKGEREREREVEENKREAMKQKVEERCYYGTISLRVFVTTNPSRIIKLTIYHLER